MKKIISVLAFLMALLMLLLRVKAGKGERMLSALLWYACCQVVLESLRMDSCLRIGFVRVSQVLSALAVLGVTAWQHHLRGGKSAAIRRCALPLICIALVGGIEWALDKTQVSNILLYAVMAALCAVMAVNALGGILKNREIRKEEQP